QPALDEALDEPPLDEVAHAEGPHEKRGRTCSAKSSRVRTDSSNGMFPETIWRLMVASPYSSRMRSTRSATSCGSPTRTLLSRSCLPKSLLLTRATIRSYPA